MAKVGETLQSGATGTGAVELFQQLGDNNMAL